MRVSFGTEGLVECRGEDRKPCEMTSRAAVWRGALAMLAAMLWMILSPAGARGLAQAPGETRSGEAPDGVLTLHAYENLIQLPVLVLSSQRGWIPPIAAERFQVSMDEGPWFRATHVRREGDDPIALTILLDRESLGGAATEAAAAAIASLGEGGLRPTDSIAVYTRGCLLEGSVHPQPGTNEGVRTALATGFPEREAVLTPGTKRPGCKNGIGLWDSLAYIEVAMKAQAGRRVVLVMSDHGEMRRDRNTVRDVWHSASAIAISIFGISEPDRMDPEHALYTLCASSGGLMLASRSERYGEALREVLALVRARYIVEFPRASNATAGVHSLRVAIEKGGDLVVRTSGISVPTADAQVMADPRTIPNDVSRLPTMGTRRPLDSH